MVENNSIDRVPPPPLIKAEWEFPLGPLPTEEDFGNDLDGKCAWKNFGELTRPQAFRKFLEHTFYYSDAFTWMGTPAFVHYYPVIERYLAEYRRTTSEDDSEAWMLAHGIVAQYSQGGEKLSNLKDRMLRLASYVRGNLDCFTLEERPRRRIDKAWLKVQQSLAGSKTAGDDHTVIASD
ncbi:MAG: hypothetical protein JWO94_2439 [Verrucomicrobiaceae bacterium]|nr:hypothetical protein [Verrucomicrobiaceae bacterium]